MKISVITCIGLLISASGLAYAEEAANTFYVGAGFNKTDLGSNTDPHTPSPITNPKNYVLDAGYNFTSNYAIEAQYSDSYEKASIQYRAGNFTITPPISYIATVESSLQTSAIYGVYRSSSNLFLKAKIGFMNTKFTLTNDDLLHPTSDSYSKSNWAAGLGAGYKFGRSGIELEYTTTGIDYNVNLEVTDVIYITTEKINMSFTSLVYNYTF
jgi:hypothetical protein